MEGVIVSAKKDGSTITISVITNAQGRYSFPAARLEPGRYSLQIRAVGYDLEGPKNADVAAGQPASADLKLRKTRNLSKQLTNAEWMMSVPGTDDDKLQLINCVSCHTLERVVKSSHDADEFVQVVARMNGYAQVSQPIKPQRRVDQSRAANPERFRKVAEYLATINLSSGMKHEFELKTLPRVKGRGTNVIITEYDLPRADHRAARRDRRERRSLVLEFRRAVPGQDRSRRPASIPNTPCRSCARASRPAISTSASTARAISCSA